MVRKWSTGPISLSYTTLSTPLQNNQQDFAWESEEAVAMTCVPLQLLRNGLLRVTVSTAAGHIPALLDTGAPLSIVNTAAARLLGVGALRSLEQLGGKSVQMDRVGSHGRWTRPCLQTAHMTI
jgi:hypothetical protein